MGWPDVGDTAYRWANNRIEEVVCTHRNKSWRTWDSPLGSFRTCGTVRLTRPQQAVFQTRLGCAIHVLETRCWWYKHNWIGEQETMDTIRAVAADLDEASPRARR